MCEKKLRQKHRQTGDAVHFGRLHYIRVEKLLKLAPHLRKYKGRVVFGDHDVRQAEGLQELFNDGGGGASFNSASEVVDGVLLMLGCDGEQVDAPMALTQGPIEATPTWASLPDHVCSDWWHNLGYDDRVCHYNCHFADILWQEFIWSDIVTNKFKELHPDQFQDGNVYSSIGTTCDTNCICGRLQTCRTEAKHTNSFGHTTRQR